MLKRELGKTGIMVSTISFGTMNFGQDIESAEAHRLLDAALELGVNLLDTAELYPVPPRPETYGRSESIIGEWIRTRGHRDDFVLASKIVGPLEDGEGEHIRDGQTRLNRRYIEGALNDSLKRLKTDYIDLYQLHWPERSTNYFERLNYVHRPDESPVPIEETVEALADMIRLGKIRTYGVSNETPWGVMTFIAAARHKNAPCVSSIQNPYNLLNRTFEIGLAEVSCREQVGLLAYSPLCFGALSGKYLFDKEAARGKRVEMPYFSRYSGEKADAAIEEYVGIAQTFGVDPAQMAIAFAMSQPFVTSVIIGARSTEQLMANIGSADAHLPPELVDAINCAHLRIQNICP